MRTPGLGGAEWEVPPTYFPHGAVPGVMVSMTDRRGYVFRKFAPVLSDPEDFEVVGLILAMHWRDFKRELEMRWSGAGGHYGQGLLFRHFADEVGMAPYRRRERAWLDAHPGAWARFHGYSEDGEEGWA